MSNEGITKEEAAKRIQSIIDDIEAKLAEAEQLADTHGLDFTFEPSHIGTYTGAGFNDDGDIDPEDVSTEGSWSPSEWNSSSLYC